MIAAIHQPNLFPRLKVLQKLALASIWIVLDDVQYAQREFQNRTLIVPNHGAKAANWLTLPVSLPFGRETRIIDTQIDERTSLEKVEKALRHSYKATPEFQTIRDDITQRLRQTHRSLIDLDVASTLALLHVADIDIRIVRSSSFGLQGYSKSARLAALCKAVGATVYLSDSGGSRYLEEEPFYTLGIEILWHVWKPPLTHKLDGIGYYVRDGSALNLLARSRDTFCETVATSVVSRQRYWSEVK